MKRLQCLLTEENPDGSLESDAVIDLETGVVSKYIEGDEEHYSRRFITCKDTEIDVFEDDQRNLIVSKDALMILSESTVSGQDMIRGMRV